MKWKFCRVKENDYYFGETHEQLCAHGLGIYFEDLKSYFYGLWNNGNLVKIYAKELSYVPPGDRPVIKPEVIYSKFLVFTEVYNLELDFSTNELFHDCGISHLNDYSVQIYKIRDIKGIFKVLKSISYMFKYKKTSFAILIKFMLVNFYSDHLEFQLVTSKTIDPWYAAQQLDSHESILSAFSSLSEYLSHIHNQDVCLDDITPSSICATFNQRNDLIFSFCDFSRARSFSREESKNGFKVKSLFSRSKSYRAHETYTKNFYDCKKSDIYSLNLSIFALIIGDKTISGLPSESAAHEIIQRCKSLKVFSSIKNLDSFRNFLSTQPNDRTVFSKSTSTTDL